MQTLADDTEVLYQVSAFYTPDSEGGLRFDEPAIGIDWPLPISEMSAKDQAWPYLGVVIIVDTALRSAKRGGRQPGPRRDDRGGFHGPRDRQLDPAFPGCARGDREPDR